MTALAGYVKFIFKTYGFLIISGGIKLIDLNLINVRSKFCKRIPSGQFPKKIFHGNLNETISLAEEEIDFYSP